MNAMTLVFLVAVFLCAASLVELIYLIYTESKFAEKRTVKKRLLYISAGGKHGQEKLSIYRQRVLKDAGVLERFALSLPRISSLDRMLLKSRVPVNASIFVLFSFALGGLGALLGLAAFTAPGTAVIMGVIFFCFPFLMLKMKEKTFMSRFEEQLPEALDLLARAVRSGHALTSGLEMVSSELDEPCKSEFAATVDEINLGLSLKEALENMCERVESLDLRFFSMAVLIHKETGGNIAEILDNISRLIRERLQFRRQVKALTAEGRLSAWILLLLPVIMFGYIYVVNYDYIAELWSAKLGIYLMVLGGFLMLVGSIVIKKIVSIEL